MSITNFWLCVFFCDHVYIKKWKYFKDYDVYIIIFLEESSFKEKH